MPRKKINPSQIAFVQKYSQYFLYLMGGLLYLGTVFDALSNAMFFVTIDVAVIASILLLGFYLVLNWYVKKRGIRWITKGKLINHKKVTTEGKLFLFGMFVLIWLSTFLNHQVSFEEVNLVCDRNKELGCNLDIKKDSIIQKVYFTTEQNFDPDKDKIERKALEIVFTAVWSGGLPANYVLTENYTNHIVGFPDIPDIDEEEKDYESLYWAVEGLEGVFRIPNGKESNSPYTMWLEDNLLQFKGIVRDLKNDEIIGWFDENEFRITESCGFSWNKDEDSVEIMDKYGFICFSIDKKEFDIPVFEEVKGVIFRGYFKYKGYYYIYSDDFIAKTKYLAEAINYIIKIKPRFDHFGENSLGKRI